MLVDGSCCINDKGKFEKWVDCLIIIFVFIYIKMMINNWIFNVNCKKCVDIFFENGIYLSRNRINYNNKVISMGNVKDD